MRSFFRDRRTWVGRFCDWVYWEIIDSRMWIIFIPPVLIIVLVVVGILHCRGDSECITRILRLTAESIR
jgi:hypothetical protein